MGERELGVSSVIKVITSNCGLDFSPAIDTHYLTQTGEFQPECHPLVREFEKIPMTPPSDLNARLKIVGVEPERPPEQGLSFIPISAAICKRTDCPFYQPVGIRKAPVIGRIIRSLHWPTELGRKGRMLKKA